MDASCTPSRRRPTAGRSAQRCRASAREGAERILRAATISNDRQIRPIVEGDNPERFAIDARDQCVVFFGMDSNVATTTSSTCAAVIEGGRPGGGSSSKPSSRRSTNRDRHFPTVGVDTFSRAATSLFDRPSAQPRTIRHRNAKPCAGLRRFAHRSSCSRSAVINSNEAFGRPVRGMHHSNGMATGLSARDTDSTHRLQLFDEECRLSSAPAGNISSLN